MLLLIQVELPYYHLRKKDQTNIMNLRKFICRIRKYHNVNRHTFTCVTCGAQTYLKEKKGYPTLSEYLGEPVELYKKENKGKKNA